MKAKLLHRRRSSVKAMVVKMAASSPNRGGSGRRSSAFGLIGIGEGKGGAEVRNYVLCCGVSKSPKREDFSLVTPATTRVRIHLPLRCQCGAQKEDNIASGTSVEGARRLEMQFVKLVLPRLVGVVGWNTGGGLRRVGLCRTHLHEFSGVWYLSVRGSWTPVP